MCGIFRASSFVKFLQLSDLNKERGADSFGGLFLTNDKFGIYKSNNIDYISFVVADQYLGHLRAPTGNTRKFSFLHSHPFEYENWIVAHNGILTNFNDLKNNMPSHLNASEQFQVDSSVIPYYLHAHGFEAFNKFKGTWACWMYNKETKELFVTRSDNTLFYNPENGDFSSYPTEQFRSFDQHKVFKLKDNNYELVYSYESKPLYFIP